MLYLRINNRRDLKFSFIYFIYNCNALLFLFREIYLILFNLYLRNRLVLIFFFSIWLSQLTWWYFWFYLIGLRNCLKHINRRNPWFLQVRRRLFFFYLSHVIISFWICNWLFYFNCISHRLVLHKNDRWSKLFFNSSINSLNNSRIYNF